MVKTAAKLGLWCLLCLGGFGLGSAAVDAAGPTTLKESQEVVNLEKVSLPPGAETPITQTEGMLNYLVTASPSDVYRFHQKQLISAGWKELPASYISEQTATGNFEKQGYLLTIIASASGDKANTTILNRGNVDFHKLPVPKGTTVLYDSPVNLMLVSPGTPEEVAKEIESGLLKEGWSPYGESGPQRFYVKNAVRLSAMVSAAPAQQGKTSVTFMSEVITADLPIPPQSEGVNYVEANRTLNFTSALSEADLQKFYRSKLEEKGWKATTDDPVKIGFKRHTIFRNPAKELIELETRGADGSLQVVLKLQSAKQVAEEDARAKAAAEKAKGEMNKPAPVVAIALPEGAEKGSVTAKRIELKGSSGSGQQISAKLRRALEADGWKTEVRVDQKEAGAYEFEKGDQRIILNFMDPGFIPAEVTLMGMGIDLKLGK